MRPLHATSENDGIPSDTPRPTTPLSDQPSRTLRRSISYASLDTVCPPKKKGIRRRIEEIAENLKPKSEKKKKKRSSTQDDTKNAAQVACDSKASPEGKAAKRGRKHTSPLRNSSHKSEEASVLAIADMLHSGVPFELDPPLAISGCKSNSLTEVLLFKEEESWEVSSFPTRSLALGARLTANDQGDLQSPPSAKVDIKDLRLDIRSSETDVTIWDGLKAAHHVFKCRLFLRCTTHLYDSVSLPDICNVEMDCNTCPAGSHYARPPALQAAYSGAAPGRTTPGGLPTVNLGAGVHMDRAWCKIQEDDGTWGWYRDVYVPLSPRLFDKTDYREFKLVSRVWVGESSVETELTFGVSMLLRGVDMN